MKTSSIIVTTLIVSATCVILAALFALDKGSKASNKITRKGKLYRDYLMDNLYDFANSVSHTFENLEDKTMRLSTIVNAKANEIKADLNQK